MPKHPIYIAMLDEAARSVIGHPHPTGRAAMRMLEHENFKSDGYVDIFDAGPTLVATTDMITSVAEARDAVLAGPVDEGHQALVATGRLLDFRATFARIADTGDGMGMDPDAIAALGIAAGQAFVHVAR
jgi:arginine N-succinyltransferase